MYFCKCKHFYTIFFLIFLIYEDLTRDMVAFAFVAKIVKIKEERWKGFHSCMNVGVPLSCPPSPLFPLSFNTLLLHHKEMIERTRKLRGRGPHDYAGYRGQWIEEVWIETFIDETYETFYPLVPLFIEVTNFCVAGDVAGLVDLFLNGLRRDVLYLVVIQHDESLCFFNQSWVRENAKCGLRNVLILSSGGYGNVALPLIKGGLKIGDRGHGVVNSVEVSSKSYDYAFAFAGKLGTHKSGFRFAVIDKIRNAIRQDNSSFLPSHVLVYEGGEEWKGKMADSMLPLTPRGYGRASFRSSEIIQLGLPQLYLYDDIPWLPYFDPSCPSGRPGRQIIWGEGGLGLVANLSGLESIVKQMCLKSVRTKNESCLSGYYNLIPPYIISKDSTLAIMGQRARELADSHFTYAGVMERIREWLKKPSDADLVCVALPQTRIGTGGGEGYE